MATSTCGKCGNHTFELIPVTPKKSNFSYYFVQCANCGVPVAALEANNLNHELGLLAKQVKALTSDVATVNNNLAIVNQNVGKLKK